ncbi:MAG: polysaccharide pyruvyl transferase family protein [Thiobacillus sp.]|nr:polysaccharide pyruvyl transferase family protein [Thiobacillus sp.]
MNYKTLVLGVAWQTIASDNLGVRALAESNMAIAKRAAERANMHVRFVEFCPNNGRIPADQGGYELTFADPLSIKRMLLGKSKYFQFLRTCDVVLDIGEGDSFSDIYGEKRFFFLSFTKLLALVANRKLVLCPQTIGPFERRWCRTVAAWLMRRATRIFTRDGLSQSYLVANGLTFNAEQVTDVAFRLPFQRLVLTPSPKIRVGVNVSGLLYNGGYTRNNQFGLKLEYKKFIETLVERLAAREDCEVHLVAHVQSESMPVEDDYAVLLKLQARFPRVIVAPLFSSASAAKSYIAAMDFFTGARMHACIAAFSAGVPVVPQAYSRKFNGLFNSLGYMHIADLKAEDAEQAWLKILHGLDNRQLLRDEVAQGNALAQEKLQRYEDFLAGLFKGNHAH